MRSGCLLPSPDRPCLRFPVGLVCAALALLLAPGCTMTRRALSWPNLDPVLEEDWYEPRDRVAGDLRAKLPTAKAEDGELPAEALGKMISYARAQNSCALLVVRRGRILLERYWCGMDHRSKVNAWSMAKTVTALAVGAAEARGFIRSVDQPVETWLTEWAGDPRGKITLRQLLQMTSGLRMGNMIRIHLGEDAAGAALDTPLVIEPGSEFRYNNVNTLLLSLIVQRASGMRYADFLSRAIWKPLGAADAAVWLDRQGGTPKTYCCLLTTARDWARVGLLLLHRGRAGDVQVVPATWVDQMLTPSALEENYGFQIWLGYSRPPCRFGDWSEPFATTDTFMLVGRDEQRVYVVPSHELVVVRIGHRAERWDDPVLPNIAVDALRTHSPLLNPTHAQGGQPVPVPASCDDSSQAGN